VLSRVSRARLTGAISEVAEASRHGSELLLKHFRVGEAVDFRRAIDRALENRFHDNVLKKAHLPGFSNKIHTFDYLIKLPHDRSIVIDTVVPDSSSVNSALVSHLDLKNAKRSDVAQAIVYDDTKPWKSADLALLRIGAPPIPFSHFPEHLEKIAA
jgi:hypothetical protein